MMWTTFSCTSWSFICFLWKNDYSVPLPIFNQIWGLFWLFCWVSSLYVWGTNSVRDMIYKYFLPSGRFFSFCWWFPLLCRSFLVCCCPTYLLFPLAFAFGVWWVSQQQCRVESCCCCCCFLSIQPLLFCWGF